MVLLVVAADLLLLLVTALPVVDLFVVAGDDDLTGGKKECAPLNVRDFRILDPDERRWGR